MSWLDKISNDLEIKTGDGNTYTPNWLNATKQRDYNVAEFEFPDLDGTFVSRKKPKGSRYNLELYFQGDLTLDIAKNFQISADDPRPWTMSHPFYGQILVQPLGLLFDNTKYNLTKITGTVVETITEENPKGSIDQVSYINFRKGLLDVTMVDAYVAAVPAPLSIDVNLITDNVTKVYKAGLPTINLDIDASEYFNKYNAALTKVLNLTNLPFDAMTAVKDFINAPILFTQSVKNRLDGLSSQFTALRDSIMTLAGSNSPLFTKSAKSTYENNAGLVVSDAAVTAITNMDYQNRNDVIAAIESILALYNQFVEDLDSFQTPNGGTTASYIPDADSLIALNDIVNITVSALFTVGLNSKQERTIYPEADTNLILLAHKVYGLSVDDSTILTLKNNNQIGLNEILNIKAGRKIIYYV